MNTTTVDNKVIQAGRYGSAIMADSDKGLPSRIEVMRAGSWPETSNKGMLYITPDDLQEFVANFKAGIGVPGGTSFGQLPIDFSHADHAEAAGWITDLEVEGIILYATVTWTDAGEAALKGGRFKCFSPSFWPACLGEYPDPEDWNKTAKNVLVGGGLTNIPFFKDLTAIMASNAGNSMKNNINVNAHKENPRMTLDEVRILDAASLTDEQKQVLADNKETLSEAELEKFGLAEKKVEASITPEPVNSLNDVDAKILADVKGGKAIVVNAAEYNSMRETVGKLEASVKAAQEREDTEFVQAHVARGAIKADQLNKWVAIITADASMKEVLTELPDNKIVASEVGTDKAQVVDASAEFDKQVQAKIDASNGALSYSDAVMRVANENADLANNRDAEIKQ